MSTTLKPQESAPEFAVETLDHGTWKLGINNMPFGRPKLDDIRDGVGFVQENDYPARGEA